MAVPALPNAVLDSSLGRLGNKISNRFTTIGNAIAS